MAGEGEEDVVSMVEVLEENIELEEEAEAVLGDSDDTVCTYLKGYSDRQAIYACITCSGPSNKQAGVCLACSYACHDGHELLELYTKRNFRCDCGNDKFPEFACKLYKDKEPKNEDNRYNQNFRGLYCTCMRPYPDPDDDVEDEMIQCIVCEDWYHGRHLGISKVPTCHDYQEMVCPSCMERCSFLWAYSIHSVETLTVKPESGASESVEVVKHEEQSLEKMDAPEEANLKDKKKSPQKDHPPSMSPSDQISMGVSHQVSSEENTSTHSSCHLPNTDKDNHGQQIIPSVTKVEKCSVEEIEQRNTTAEGSGETSRSKSGSVDEGGAQQGEGSSQKECPECVLENLKKRNINSMHCATFWKNGWRSKLCTCPSCKKMYTKLEINFIRDQSDTVFAYEKRGKEKQVPTQYEAGIQALAGIDRFQQVEMLQGYNDMKSELREFLQNFASQGKVVKREDIDQFFSEMQAKKRQKTGPMQYFCR